MTTVGFEGFREKGSWVLPTVLRKRFTHSRGSLPEEEWVLHALTLDPPDLEERLRFDPEAPKAGRVDPSTGDVFAPDGTFRYNEKDVLAALDARTGKAGRWRIALYVLVPTAVVLSALVAYRRLRAGGP